MGSPELQAPPPQGEVESWGSSWGHVSTSAVSGVIRFVVSTPDGGWGLDLWVSPCLEKQDPCPSAAAAQLPLTVGTAVAGRSELCNLQEVLPVTCCYQVLRSCELSCHGWRTWDSGTVSTVPLVLPCLCAPVHPLLDVQLCGILRHPGISGRGMFVELWMF